MSLETDSIQPKIDAEKKFFEFIRRSERDLGIKMGPNYARNTRLVMPTSRGIDNGDALSARQQSILVPILYISVTA
jgi:hypothetical protein